ncbi:hypothetical protein WDU94_010943 [Cyamophila willieti]
MEPRLLVYATGKVDDCKGTPTQNSSSSPSHEESAHHTRDASINMNTSTLVLNSSHGDSTYKPTSVSDGNLSADHTGCTNSKRITMCDNSAQTTIDFQIWIHMKDSLTNKIIEKEKEILRLQARVKELEEEKAKANKKPRKKTKKSKELLLMKSVTNIDIVPSKPSKKQVSFETPAAEGRSVFMLGDSHVRGLSGILSSSVPASWKVEAFFQPGAGYYEVANTLTKNPKLVNQDDKDCVIICCGTNDVCSSDWSLIQEGLDKLIKDFKMCTTFCIIGAPLRLDSRRMNQHVIRFNTKIKHYFQSRVRNFFFVNPVHFLKPKHYLRDGIHLNKIGKILLCNKIRNTIIGNVCTHESHDHEQVDSYDSVHVGNTPSVRNDISLNSSFNSI